MPPTTKAVKVALEAASGTTPGLRANAIGLREVLFQSITGMAPAAAVTASIPAGAGFAGGSMPLAVLIALVACLFSASSIGLLAREMPAAGSLATYAARGIHPSAGFLTAWGYILVAVLIPPLVLLQLGFTVAGTINSYWSSYPASLWWPWALLGALIVLVAGYFGVRTSARMGTILGVFEIAVLLVLAVFFIVHAGGHNTLKVFGDGYTSGTYKGISGVIAGSVYTVLAFGGFEGAAPLAEESKNPRKTVQRAVVFSTLGIGIFYVFTTYAVDVAFGPGKFSAFTIDSSQAASWQGMAKALYGFFWFFVFLAVVNSTIANANAGVNVASRMSYAMGRIKTFPAALAQVSAKHRSPVLAIFVAFLATCAVALGLGLGYGPETAFSMVATGIVLVLIAIYILMNVACIGYFAQSRNRAGSRWNVVLHLIFPVLGIAVFVPAWLTAAGITVFSFVAPLPAPIWYMAPGVGGFMVVGIIYLAYLYARHPQRVAEVGLVHLDEEPTTAAAATTAEG
jgi:amino acid transporter